MRLPLGTVLVAGPSMLPALHPGDCLVVRRGGRVRPGDVVVAEPLARPGLLVVKRAVRPVGPPGTGAWWVEGDNPLAGDDSRTFGAVSVRSRVVLRYWPLSRAGRVPARSGPS